MTKPATINWTTRIFSCHFKCRLTGHGLSLSWLLPRGASGALVVTTEGGSQFGEFFAVAPGQVVFLQRIGFQVVKFVRLEGGVVNELPVAPAEGVLVLPVVAQAAFAADKD